MARMEVLVEGWFEAYVVVDAVNEDEGRNLAVLDVQDNLWEYSGDSQLIASHDVLWLDDEPEEQDSDAGHLIHPHVD